MIGKGHFNLWVRFRSPGGGEKTLLLAWVLCSSRPSGQEWQRTDFYLGESSLNKQALSLCVHRVWIRFNCNQDLLSGRNLQL